MEYPQSEMEAETSGQHRQWWCERGVKGRGVLDEERRYGEGVEVLAVSGTGPSCNFTAAAHTIIDRTDTTDWLAFNLE